MRNLLFGFSILMMLLSSCNSKSIRGELSTEDSLRLIQEEYQKQDVKLSYKGLIVGDSLIAFNHNDLYGDSLTLYKKDDYTYQGCTYISFINENNEKQTEYPNLHVNVIDGRIARISFLSKSWGLCKFFIDTFNERYYKREPIKSGGLGEYKERYYWLFKDQCISVDRKYHIDPGSGIYHITDDVLIVYEDNTLGERIDEIFEKRDSLRNEAEKNLLDVNFP